MATLTLMYIGVKKESNIRYDLWANITGKENDGKKLKYTTKDILSYKRDSRLADASPGQIFQFNCKKNSTTVFTQTAKYLGVWANQYDVTTWQAEYATHIILIEEMQVRDKQVRHDIKLLHPLRRAYLRSTKIEQNLMLAQIIGYITAPMKKKEVST